jgi:hypothetical protein
MRFFRNDSIGLLNNYIPTGATDAKGLFIDFSLFFLGF